MLGSRSTIITSMLLIAVGTLLISCTPSRRRDAEKIEALRAEAEELIKAQELMGWNSWVYGSPSNQDSLYKPHTGLFSKENISLLRKVEGEEPDSIQKKRLRYFRRYLIREYVTKETAPLTDRVSNIESSARITFEGKQIPYRQMGSVINNEPSQKRRAGLYVALDPVLDTLNTILREVKQKNRTLANELGYASYIALSEEVKGISLVEFKPVLEQFLVETDSSYTGLLREAVQGNLKLPVQRFYRHDIGALFRMQQYDAHFPARQMLEHATSTYKSMGFDLGSNKNLTIDAEPRERKNPRAVCYLIDIPSDIRLSVKPSGGFGDYRSLFHELGHALHYVNTREHAFEFKYLGEPTVTETYAFLSEYLLINNAWLRLRTPMSVTVQKEFLRLQALYRMYFVRRYCAKVLYELQLHGGVQNPSGLYADLLARYTGHRPLPSDEKRYLVDVDPLFYAASYLRAWFLEGQLNAKLSRDYGVNWFEHPEAGVYLQSLWAEGDRYQGDEFVRRMGEERISPDELLAELRTMVLFSTK